MNIISGSLIISTPLLDNSVFEKTVIFLSKRSEEGIVGFVINKLFPQTLKDLAEFKNSPAFSLYEGGPVEIERLYFLHQRPDIIEGGIKVSDNIYLSGNFYQAVNGINRKLILEQDIKLFIGYCGWDKHQLEEEIAEGSWLPVNAALPSTIFVTDTSMLWDELYAEWAN